MLKTGIRAARRLAFVAGLLAGTVAGAQTGPADEVRMVNDAFDAILGKRDIAALEQAWAHDAWVSASHPSSKSPIVGWEAVRKSWEGAFANFPELSVTLKNPHVVVQQDVAWVVGVETIRGRNAAGNEVQFEAMTTNVYVRRGGKWLMVHHQASRTPQ